MTGANGQQHDGHGQPDGQPAAGSARAEHAGADDAQHGHGQPGHAGEFIYLCTYLFLLLQLYTWVPLSVSRNVDFFCLFVRRFRSYRPPLL